MDNNQIINEVKEASGAITRFASRADTAGLLQCYAAVAEFRACAGDGSMRKFDAFKTLCTDYFGPVASQNFVTVQQDFNILDANLVIMGWTGNIQAFFKNGDVMNLNNYAVTNVFKKINGGWKVVHSHESSLLPEIIKAAGR